MSVQPISAQAMWMKKLGYLIFLLPPLLLPLSEWLWNQYGAADLFAFTAVVVVFGVIPLLDHLLGQDAVNPDESEVESLSGEWYYRLLTLACVPLYGSVLVYGYLIFQGDQFSLIGQLGWLLSMGTVGGIIAINVAHELIHKEPALEQNAGGLLLAMVCYGGFKVEHVRGHHVQVSTPNDASSSRYGQNLYSFLPHAWLHNFLNAWKLEAKKLKVKKQSVWSVHNELIWWYGISLVLAITFAVLGGVEGLMFFLGQSFFAFTLLEIINYVEHYGLHRRKLESGRYERPNIRHSWNSNYLLTNLFLFQLQRHSDHHAFPRRRYQVLRHHEESPQLPSGYAGMVVLALLPPLWFRVMNPRVEAYYQGEEHQLQS
ncbi:alkane 1-monooxygenase [Parendozoicomonas haliclonae]|uniref:Alkane 1-monooxygenase 2 n=1 Tax=Parendozoicomonas haliclonae TaxID=1960125 RepID=A0A1X7ALX7_9GAMM|nr:alkane 1-monooxygenase [Parendozoicomonas haliclonae]SMA49138.1 Alkane 1-monooxygenase 2 [Parendozoicomonas haliclonae]